MGGQFNIYADEDKEGEIRSWSDISELLLSKIRSRLYGKDAAAFSGVCKAWNKVPRFLQEEGLLLLPSPCLYLPEGLCFHPLQNKFFEPQTMAALPKGVILAQSDNWLLMLFLHDSPFFFNPSTNQMIVVPILYLRTSLLYVSATFSSPPTSPDCELVTFRQKYLEDDDEMGIAVRTMKRGERGFSTKHIVRTSGRFKFLQHCRAVFHKGEYYCMGKEGNMVVYNSEKNKSRLTGSPRYLWSYFSASDCSHYMFEGEGDLWAVFTACRGAKVCVLRLNWSSKIWEKVHDLEDRMVFVSHRVSFMERAKRNEAGRRRGNKIYFPRLRDGKCLFYCLATKRYYTEEGSDTSYESFHGSEEMVPCTWINMDVNPLSYHETCDQSLSW